jgi:hypothetical protein
MSILSDVKKGIQTSAQGIDGIGFMDDDMFFGHDNDVTLEG